MLTGDQRNENEQSETKWTEGRHGRQVRQGHQGHLVEPDFGEHSIVLVDGVCSLCQGVTRFVIRHDLEGWFLFASLQSETGMKLLKKYGIPMTGRQTPGYNGDQSGSYEKDLSKPQYESVVLIDKGRYYLRSDAALRIAAKLNFPWNLIRFLRIIPKGIRDGLYRYIADHRYRWFGKDETCLVPSPELSDRFLDQG
ncbi:thiol-disulfide oxidoreductase DCC family protein [Paenibacillus physcomitrellae]|uniref:Thiol-disulfide oxidoreductase DCC n=1 Tax=Paenibacillus physcomitrellae TaxID=1619311 RepID=A0ABQ1G582_9BACL|nr:DCC1-like thiol-disulfide oxidoreductase family protein [Paenibacillus physcomitrellae]GGA37309.1 hypothetical protein GCM10010917_23090 [Paenibacillus physcomitrellae]